MNHIIITVTISTSLDLLRILACRLFILKMWHFNSNVASCVGVKLPQDFKSLTSFVNN